MLRVAILLVAIAVAYAKPQMFGMDDKWEYFKRINNKAYGANEESRRAIFESNVAFINTHNMQADSGMHSYRLEMNGFGDMTRDEITAQFNGYTNAKTTSGSTFLPASNVNLPTEIDWRNQGYVTPIKDQKQCGSCWAFSATGSLEGQHFKKTGSLVSLSEQNLVDCSRPEGNLGCEGGLMDQAFTYIKKNSGIDKEISYPYTAKNGQCHFNRANVGATDTGFVDVTRMDENALQQAVATVGPISVAIDASRSTFHFYKSGVYDDVQCSSTRLDHGVLAIGYGTQSSDYWLVKNSWGTMWGMQGFIMMSRNKNNQCGIATAASFPLV